MPNSFAQTTNLTCSQCHQPFPADVWQIVDVNERPDLLEQIEAKSLHALPCPHCSSVCTLDIALLVYQPDDAPHLTFSPAQGAGDEEAPQQASSLVDMLSQTLGSAWQDVWLTQLAVVPHPLLADTLYRDPEHVLQPTIPSWFDIIDQFIGADSWGESQRIVATYPELLDKVTDVLLTLLASLQKDKGAGASWEEHLILLRRCREVGIDQAFAEKTRTSGQMAIPTELQDDLRQADASNENYLSTSNQAELDNALAAWQRILNHPALVTTPLDFQLAIFGDAGRSFLSRYRVHGRIDDLNQALRLWTAAVVQTAADAPGRPRRLNNLGTGLRAHYARTGRLEDLEQAIAAYQQAVALTATDTPDRPIYLNNLGTGLGDRYIRTGRLEDLEQAIATYQQAVALTPADDRDRPERLSNLGNCLCDHYAHTGRLEDLEQAIAAFQQAVVLIPADAPGQPAILNNLGGSLLDRYECTGRLEDLEQAIAAYQQAVAQIPDDASDGPAILNNLGRGLHNGYTRTGRLEDLEQAIAAYQQALTRTKTNAPNRPAILTNLGSGLRDRYRGTGRLEGLDQAIVAFQQAVAQTATGILDRPAILTNLGSGLRDRYRRTGRLEDLGQAIIAFQQAVTQTPADATAQPIHLNNLGTGLSTYYTHTGRLEDLEQAIVAFQQAVTQTPADATAQPIHLNNLGTGLRYRYARTGRLEDLEQGTNSYRQACEQGLTVALSDALLSARNWGEWALARSNWEEASAAYDYGLTAIDRLFAVQLVRSAQEGALGLGRGIHTRAAYALARNGDLATAAITVERGRARLLAEALQSNRADLLMLSARGHTDLYHRYRNAVEQRQRLLQPIEPSTTLADPRLRGLARLQALEAAQAEIDAAITAIQQIPGYEDFFAQPTIAQLQAAAQVAPLVYLLTTEAGGLALIVQVDKITAVWLDGFTEEKLGELINGWFGAYHRQRTARQTWLAVMDRVTHVLWDTVMRPVGAALHKLSSLSPQMGMRSGGKVVTLIPTGLLSLLPLHAAWTESEQSGTRRYFLDKFVVNYAPSARSLTHAITAALQVTGVQLLAVDEPRPIHGNALPNSAAEVAAIADHFVQPQLFPHEQATRAAILAALPQAQVAHFSCHGATDWENALESGLLMAHDEMLTVRDLLELQLPDARLATLSACETGIVGTKLPDEVVALPSALLQAGFAGVVASLWSVADISTAMLMSRFYDYWQNEQSEPAQALRAAQRWVRDTTNREKADYFDEKRLEASSATRMPEMVAADFLSAALVHEDGQDARSFAHPYWWAAFYLTGV